jgi:hypothetical protein
MGGDAAWGPWRGTHFQGLDDFVIQNDAAPHCSGVMPRSSGFPWESLPRSPRLAAFLVLAAHLAGSATAEAYALRRTASGTPVRWAHDEVTLELDPSVTAALPGSLDAVNQAAAAWAAGGAGPTLQVALAESASMPGVDGRNVVYFIPGYPEAAGALAITIVSCDELTGAILDADVVINGTYDFAVLAPSARAAAGAVLFANEAAGEATTSSPPSLGWLGPSATGLAATETRASTSPFDFVHILAHETGHVLGLEDVLDEPDDVMFLYSAPGDAERRAPAPDDIAGVAFLYGASPPAPRGCRIAFPDPSDDSRGLPLVGVAVAVVAWRRRSRSRRYADRPSPPRPPSAPRRRRA